MLTQYSSVVQIILRYWEHLIHCEMQGRKVCWHLILHSHLCNALCKFYIKIFPKHILKPKVRDQSIQARKKLFCHVIVQNCVYKLSWKFLTKIESTWRREIKEQAPQLTLLYPGRIVRSSHRRYCIRKLFLKILQYHRKHLRWSLFSKKLQTLRPVTLSKREPKAGVFLRIH